MFLFAGGSKLAGAPMMVQMFDAIGVGQWFRYLTGAIEVTSAVLLLVPSLAFFGALALAATMVGAVVTHLFVIGGSPAMPIVLLAATGTIAWLRRPVADLNSRSGCSRRHWTRRRAESRARLRPPRRCVTIGGSVHS